MIARIEDLDHLEFIIRDTHIVTDEPSWNAVKWVREVLRRLSVDDRALGVGVTDWKQVRDGVVNYRTKKDEAGCFEALRDRSKVPTYDLMQELEIVI